MLYFSIQKRLQDRTSKVAEAAGARRRCHGQIMLGSRWDHARNVVESASFFLRRKQFKDF